jgi:hypothetical protein
MKRVPGGRERWLRRKRLRLVAMAFPILLTLFLAHAELSAGAAPTGEMDTQTKETEAKVKVAYVYNFLRFVDWPVQGETSASAPVRICVVGNDPIRTMLGELSIRRIRERPIQVEHVKGMEPLRDCHLAYLTRSEEARLPQILQQIEGLPVLSVSDIPGFARKGGMFGFATEENRVKVEISQSSVRQSGLKVSAKLLEIARLVP